jgi:hypothetical protein
MKCRNSSLANSSGPRAAFAGNRLPWGVADHGDKMIELRQGHEGFLKGSVITRIAYAF